MKSLHLAAVAALLAGTSLSAHAAPVTFFGEDVSINGNPTPNATAARNTFFSNLNGVGTETFDSIANGTSNPSLTFPSAGTASLTGGGQVETGANGVGRFPISGSNYYEANAGTFGVTFSGPIAAFGFYATDIGDYGGQLSLSLTDINNVVTNLLVPHTIGSNGSTNGSALYFGFYDLANQYVSIAFNNSAGGDGFGFDDFSVGSIQQVTPRGVPEPITLSLFGAGVAGAAFIRRRRKA